MPNVKLVFAGSKQVLGKFEVRLAGLIALRRREEEFGTLYQTNRHSEDAHQKSTILSSANQSSLGHRDKFLSQPLAPLLNDPDSLTDNMEGACRTGKKRAEGKTDQYDSKYQKTGKLTGGQMITYQVEHEFLWATL